MPYNVYIIDDPQFADDNQTFVADNVQLKKLGMAVVKHYEEITWEDLHNVYTSFDTSTPRGLQEKVLLNIIFYLCRRGQENLTDMTKRTFNVFTDANGRRYVTPTKDELDKNHREDDENLPEGHIYETPGT